ncbi:MAG: class I SAM-dependent methyltransferase, partial [Candidatus Hodarchaeota archaeon]
MDYIPNYLLKSGAIEIRDFLVSISSRKVLDVATQSGDFISTLMNTLRDYESFVGIDISREKWDPKTFENESVTFIEMNAENLEFDDNTFDMVTISHSLHHLTKI